MVYTLGEVLLDIIFKPDGETVAIPGGAMLNSSVSMARKNIPVSIISETGNDKTGKMIIDFLNKNNVNTTYITKYENIKTSLALAFLDENAKPDYTFYKEYPPKRELTKNIDFKKSDILIFASFYSVDPAIRKEVLSIVKKAKKTGATLVYDPNIRHKSHLKDKSILNSILENIALADLIKGSDEDFTNIFGEGIPDFWNEKIKSINKSSVNIITLGEKGAVCYFDNSKTEQKAKDVNVKSTVGAGDAFGAGMVYGILNTGKTLKQLTSGDWKTILNTATGLAADVCNSDKNFI